VVQLQLLLPLPLLFAPCVMPSCVRRRC